MNTFTEEEANTKWCPFARVDGAHGAFNRNGYGLSGLSLCTASRCMAWCWMPDEIDPITGHSFKAGTGFCGLAGRPE